MNKLIFKCLINNILNIVELIAIDSSFFHLQCSVENVYTLIVS